MEYIVVFLVIVLTLVGIAGSILPALPGLPFNYIALLVLQFYVGCFSTSFLISWAAVTVLIMVFDYFFPIWTAKKFGATRQGIIGSMIGMVAGIIFTPIGMLLGMFAGAIIGDMIAGKKSNEALKSGLATFAGTLLSTGVKLIAAGIMSYYAVKESVKIIF